MSLTLELPFLYDTVGFTPTDLVSAIVFTPIALTNTEQGVVDLARLKLADAIGRMPIALVDAVGFTTMNLIVSTKTGNIRPVDQRSGPCKPDGSVWGRSDTSTY